MQTTVLSCLLFLLLVCGIHAQKQRVVTEVLRGSIFRQPTFVTVDHYRFEITTASAIVEFDVLSAETSDNQTFVDVNKDCDSAFIDSHVYLFRVLSNGATWQLVASNDDEADDLTGYYGRGRRDGSLSAQDSYLIRQLTPGFYILAVGRFPLTVEAAMAGKSTDAVNEYSPYTCQTRMATYGNYQVTVRSQSTSSATIMRSYANTYVGDSCVAATTSKQCVYRMYQDSRNAIIQKCAYDKTV